MKHFILSLVLAVTTVGAIAEEKQPSAAKKPGMFCRISQVDRGSPYHKVGLRNGDEIMEFNGRACRSARDIRILDKFIVAEKHLSVKILRRGKERTIEYAGKVVVTPLPVVSPLTSSTPLP